MCQCQCIFAKHLTMHIVQCTWVSVTAPQSLMGAHSVNIICHLETANVQTADASFCPDLQGGGSDQATTTEKCSDYKAF